MKLENYKIISLVNSGLLNITEHSLSAKDALISYNFRRAIGRAAQELSIKEQELSLIAGIKENETPTEEQLARLNELFTELAMDTTDIGDHKKLSFEAYHKLANENKDTTVYYMEGTESKSRQVDVFKVCEEILDGVLFEICPVE